MGKKSEDIGSMTISDALEGKAVDLDAAIEEIGAASGEEAAPAKAEAAPPAAAEPAPKPKEPARAAPAETDDDAPAPKAAEGDEDAWIEELPEAHRARARQQANDLRGQRHALARRTQKIENLENERRDLVGALAGKNRELDAFVAQHRAGPNGAQPPAAPGAPVLKLVPGDDGELTIPVDEVARALETRSEPQRRAQQQNAEAMNARAQYANQILATAGVEMPTQNKLTTAVRDMAGMFKQLTDETGSRPRNNAEEIALMRQHGVEERLRASCPGVTLEDLYDLIVSAQDPYNQGHRLTGIAKRYQESWNGGGAATPAGARPPAGSPAPKSRLAEHPPSLAKSGGSGDASGDPDSLDAIASLSIKDALDRGKKSVTSLLEGYEKDAGFRMR